MKRITLAMSMCLTMIALAACGSSAPKTIDLNRSFIMTDEEGRRAGTVVFHPLGDGEILDNNQQVIGIITAPAR